MRYDKLPNVNNSAVLRSRRMKFHQIAPYTISCWIQVSPSEGEEQGNFGRLAYPVIQARIASVDASMKDDRGDGFVIMMILQDLLNPGQCARTKQKEDRK